MKSIIPKTVVAALISVAFSSSDVEGARFMRVQNHKFDEEIVLHARSEGNARRRHKNRKWKRAEWKAAAAQASRTIVDVEEVQEPTVTPDTQLQLADARSTLVWYKEKLQAQIVFLDWIWNDCLRPEQGHRLKYQIIGVDLEGSQISGSFHEKKMAAHGIMTELHFLTNFNNQQLQDDEASRNAYIKRSEKVIKEIDDLFASIALEKYFWLMPRHTLELVDPKCQLFGSTEEQLAKQKRLPGILDLGPFSRIWGPWSFQDSFGLGTYSFNPRKY